MTEIAQQIASLGGTVILAALFVWQFIQERTHNREREEKLYTIISTLAADFPGMKQAIERIEKKLDEGGKVEYVGITTPCEFARTGKPH